MFADCRGYCSFKTKTCIHDKCLKCKSCGAVNANRTFKLSGKENKHTIALTTPNNMSVKLLHLIMPLQVIPWSPSCLFCLSGIHRERNRQRNHGSTPLVQSRCTKEQPYARANKNLLQKILVTRNKLLVGDSQTDYTGVLVSSATQASIELSLANLQLLTRVPAFSICSSF